MIEGDNPTASASQIMSEQCPNPTRYDQDPTKPNAPSTTGSSPTSKKGLRLAGDELDDDVGGGVGSTLLPFVECLFSASQAFPSPLQSFSLPPEQASRRLFLCLEARLWSSEVGKVYMPLFLIVNAPKYVLLVFPTPGNVAA